MPFGKQKRDWRAFAPGIDSVRTRDLFSRRMRTLCDTHHPEMKPMRLLLITAALCFGSLGSLSAQTTVRVLSYNIHRDIGASDSNISAQPSLAKIVNYLKPDVWTIAELGGNNASFNAIN